MPWLVNSSSVSLSCPLLAQESVEFNLPTDIRASPIFEPSYPSVGNLAVDILPAIADPSRPYVFQVSCAGNASFSRVLSPNLGVSASLEAPHSVEVSLRAATSICSLPSHDGVRISISPGWWGHAQAFSIDRIELAGHEVALSCLPARIQVLAVNHAPSSKGLLWAVSKAGNVAAVEAAVIEGCSTEERDEVSHPGSRI